MNFELSSPFSPTGDQPEAIAALSDGINRVRKDFHYRQCDQGSAEADFDPES